MAAVMIVVAAAGSLLWLNVDRVSGVVRVSSNEAEAAIPREVQTGTMFPIDGFNFDPSMIEVSANSQTQAPAGATATDPVRFAAPEQDDLPAEPAVREQGEAVASAPAVPEARPARQNDEARGEDASRTVADRPVKPRRVERHATLTNHDANGNAIDAAVTGNALIAEARRYLGTNPTNRATLWCGAFLDLVLRRTGHRGGGNLALGYTRYGKRISGPQVGAIVVLTRKGGGHVGIVTGVDVKGNPIVISGNHNRRVAEATYPRSRVVAYVVP